MIALLAPAAKRVALQLIAWLIAVAILLAIYYVGMASGISKANADWQKAWDEQVIKLQAEKTAALETYIAEQQRLTNELETIRNESIKQIDQARADAAAADAVAVSLHDKAARLAKRANQCTTDTTTTIRGQAAIATNRLLADLFKEADEEAGTMAAAYDRARAAGLACERAYDAARIARSAPR